MSDDITIPPLVPNGYDEVVVYFGDPKFSGAADASVDPHWEQANMTLARNLPCGISKLYCHHLIEPYLRLALGRAESTGWKPKSIGCFQPRLVRGSQTLLSLHTFGIAVDADADDNKMVLCPSGNPLAMYAPGDARRIAPGPMTIPDAVVQAFKSAGFFWGGEFRYRFDPMHFQLATGC